MGVASSANTSRSPPTLGGSRASRGSGARRPQMVPGGPVVGRGTRPPVGTRGRTTRRRHVPAHDDGQLLPRPPDRARALRPRRGRAEGARGPHAARWDDPGASAALRADRSLSIIENQSQPARLPPSRDHGLALTRAGRLEPPGIGASASTSSASCGAAVWWP